MIPAFNHRAHKLLWSWIASYPELSKRKWPGWDVNGGLYSNLNGAYCFACDACVDCLFCPLVWPGESKTCSTIYGLFTHYAQAKHAKNWEQASILANRICNLPINPSFKGVII